MINKKSGDKLLWKYVNSRRVSSKVALKLIEYRYFQSVQEEKEKKVISLDKDGKFIGIRLMGRRNN